VCLTDRLEERHAVHPREIVPRDETVDVPRGQTVERFHRVRLGHDVGGSGLPLESRGDAPSFLWIAVHTEHPHRTPGT
jgi:hypothetical protein